MTEVFRGIKGFRHIELCSYSAMFCHKQFNDTEPRIISKLC